MADLGAQVRRGETGALVVFYKDVSSLLPVEESGPIGRDGAGDDVARHRRFVAKASTVFNIAQVDNAPAETPDTADTIANPIEAEPIFDAFVAGTGARIQIGGDRAAYVPTIDTILIPPRNDFRSPDGYTATLAHELVHWTAAPHRLDRDLTQRFGTQAYAAEELVAELGSAFVLASLNLATTPHPQHAAYMAGWLPVLRRDPRALFTAAARASAAVDYLHGLVERAPSLCGNFRRVTSN